MNNNTPGNQEIPYGYCQCGCGQKTTIAPRDDVRYGWIRGKPLQYIQGHNKRHPDLPVNPPNPGGLCMCGCGNITPVAKQTHTRNGYIKGEHICYLPGHATRVRFGSLLSRFWAGFNKRGFDECWEWKSGLDKDGYGSISQNRKHYRAHRFSYELHYGPIPEGLSALHRCDNPRCVNPNHLFLGTSADNVADMLQKNRFGRSKLTPEEVTKIRDLYERGGVTHADLAAEYGVSGPTIGRIVNRKGWHHIP